MSVIVFIVEFRSSWTLFCRKVCLQKRQSWVQLKDTGPGIQRGRLAGD